MKAFDQIRYLAMVRFFGESMTGLRYVCGLTIALSGTVKRAARNGAPTQTQSQASRIAPSSAKVVLDRFPSGRLQQSRDFCAQARCVA